MLSQLLDYSYMSLTDFITSRYVKKTFFNTVFINLWSDTASLKSSVGNVYKNCLHKVIHQDTKRCTSCKAFVGHISEEAFDIDYYNSIYWLKSNITADEIFIVTPRYYPDNFSPKLYGDNLLSAMKSKSMYSKTYQILDRKPRGFHSRGNKSAKSSKTYYLIHFATKRSYLFKDDNYISKVLKPQLLLKQRKLNSRSVILNPYYNELVMAENVLNIICNSNIMKYINKGRKC